jgi:hypothetical protein
MAEFWSTPGMEPKRGYRWIMDLALNGVNQLQSFLIKRTSRPSWTLTESSHVFLNHTFYYPGRVQYNELSVQVVDSVDPNAARVLMNLLAQAGYIPPDRAEDNWQTVSKGGWNVLMGNPVIKQLDENGDVMEEWSFYNTWIKSCTLGDLDYTSDEMLNVDMVLRYDYFKMGGGTSPAGASPGISDEWLAPG